MLPDYPAIAKLGLSFADRANAASFGENPYMAWCVFRLSADHTQGFDQLLEIARTTTHGDSVFTSNGDGQFQCAARVPRSFGRPNVKP